MYKHAFSCNVKYYPSIVNGGWCDWTEFDECRASDTGPFKRRIRECTCPPPANGGSNCVGEDFQVQSCSYRNKKKDGCSSVADMEGSGYLNDDEDC